MWRVNVHKDKISILVSIIGAFASVASVTIPLLILPQNAPWWAIALIVVFVLLMLIAIILVLKSETMVHVYQIEDQQGIRNYMFRWIRNGGRVAIWTRDMSWVNDEEMRQMLRDKAERRELIICLPEEIDKSTELEQRGAEVIAYDTWEAPATRFTIVNYEQEGSRVAVGRRHGNLHFIQEFSAGEHTAFHMAQDLVRLVREQNNTREQ